MRVKVRLMSRHKGLINQTFWAPPALEIGVGDVVEVLVEAYDYFVLGKVCGVVTGVDPEPRGGELELASVARVVERAGV